MKIKPQKDNLEKLADRFTSWVGSPASILAHTILFIAAFGFVWLGVKLETVLLVLTTAVSLEAIYLALFIQMSVNRNTQSLAEVEEDIDEIQEDVEEIEKDIDEIQEDVEEIEKDVDEIQEDVEEIEKEIDEIEEDEKQDIANDENLNKLLIKVQQDLIKISQDIESLKQKS